MKIGMVGGIGSESTVDYYKSIIAGYRETVLDGSYPKIIIESIDMTEMLGFVSQRDWEGLAAMLQEALKNLGKAGAEIAVIASNTPHVVFDRVKAASPVPVLSIVEATCKRAEEMQLKKMGLLGTAFTMKEGFFEESFSKSGMTVVVPNPEEQKYIHEKIFSELEFGRVETSTKTRFVEIVWRMIAEEGIEGLILGCTELPLLLSNRDFEIPLLNTVQIHVQSILKEVKKRLEGGR